MRSKLKKCVIFLMIAMLLTPVFMLSVFADENEEPTSCPDYYFSNLSGDDVPYNVIGSCGYVATSIFLAYYDVYWNDYFVKNKYENDATYSSDSNSFISSTIKTENHLLHEMYKEYCDEVAPEERMSETTYLKPSYIDFVMSHLNKDYLHLDLIGMGIDKGYYSGMNPANEYAITIQQTAKILDDYFDVIFGDHIYYDPLGLNSVLGDNPPIKIKVLKSSALGTSHSEVVEKMYELLNESIPVMYRGSDGTTGHRMIAYDAIKDDNCNIVDCKLHTGLIGEELTTLSATEYDEDIAILWIEIDETRIPHRCSNNYVIGNERYCSCQVYGDLHPEHEHEAGKYLDFNTVDHRRQCKWDDGTVQELHEFSISSEGSSYDYHIEICECGYSREVNHILKYSDYHNATCACGHERTTPHEYTYVSASENGHILVCPCGNDSIRESHTYKYKDLNDGTHRAVCACGYSVEVSHTLELMSNYNSETHHAFSCVCGYILSERHQYSFAAISDDAHRATCVCGDSYEEEHELIMTEISDEKHAFICECGYSYEEEHSLSWWQRSDTNHTFICSCGYRYTEPHNFIEQDYHTSECNVCKEKVTTPHESEIYEQLSATQHLVVCGCGYEGAAPHIFTCVSVSASLHRATCICGYTTLEIHTFRQSTSLPRYESCISCGYTRDNLGPGGGNVIMGKKEDDENEETE